MRPEAAFPYVSAAEGAQHPPKKPPRSTFRHAQRPAATTAAGETVLLCGNEDRQSKLRAQKKNEDSRTAALIVIYQDIA